MVATQSTLRAAVAYYLGYGTTSADWTVGQTAEIDSIIEEGYKQFLYPVVDGVPYYWSFLTRVATVVNTVIATNTVALPSDFAAFKGDVYFNDTVYRGKIKLVPMEIMLDLQQSAQSGLPSVAAVYIDSTTGAKTLMLYPIPDAVYPLRYMYEIEPVAISSSAATPLGGQRHSSTILAACLAEAESHVNDIRGEKYEKFKERLIASITEDRKNQTYTAIGVMRGTMVGDVSRGRDTTTTFVQNGTDILN